MSGFSEEEIAAEIKSRNNGIFKRNENHREAMREREISECDAVCLSCGTPVKSYMVTDSENPMCDTCLGV